GDGRRRQGHAPGARGEGAGQRAACGARGGGRGLRRHGGLSRAGGGRAAPRGDPGAGRRARRHGAPRRARVLDPATPPEADRGVALAVRGYRAACAPGVREDSGAYEGYTVPRFYDTLLAKLIVWGADRATAVERMLRALGEYKVVGVRTTIPALERIVGHPDFRAGRLSTALLERIL